MVHFQIPNTKFLSDKKRVQCNCKSQETHPFYQQLYRRKKITHKNYFWWSVHIAMWYLKRANISNSY
jgi:hypothetical protein